MGHTRLFLEVLLVKESCSLISGESVRTRHLVIATQERRPGHCPPKVCLIRTSRQAKLEELRQKIMKRQVCRSSSWLLCRLPPRLRFSASANASSLLVPPLHPSCARLANSSWSSSPRLDRSRFWTPAVRNQLMRDGGSVQNIADIPDRLKEL
jgi:hypothetical protein